MALRFQYLILFFCFVLLMGWSNGARDIVEEDRKLHDQASYITGYKTTKGEEVEDAKETSQFYISGYKNVKEMSQPYITGYRNVKASSQPYITGYRNVKGSSQPYITGYRNVKESSQPYITSYGDAKESNQPYITSYENTKETSQPYTTSYGDAKETSQSYITNYGDTTKTSQPYITSYGKETNQLYITQYGDVKKTSQPYITRYGDTKERSQPYITQYGDAKERSQPYTTSYGDTKERSQPYITQYGDAKERSQPYTTSYGDVKETIQSYITSYGDAENTNKRPYVTAHGNAKETKKGPYVTGHGNAYGTSQDPKSKCNDHVHSSSHNGGHENKGHEHHMHTQSSTGLDQNEAFKVGFFIPKNLYAEKTMPLYFPIKDHSGFLPKEVADSIPFSLSQLPNLLQLFSIPQGSPEAKEMEQTLLECRAEPIDAEIKLCATSLESMVDFVNRILGSDQNQFNLLSTTHPTITTALTQNYTVLEAPKEVSAPKMVFCHPEPYPYAVFFCHYFGTETKVFRVSLSGESGDKVDAIAVCHMDTSDWDPNHVLFQMLGVKPGASSPVCHFLPANHLVWLPSPTKATA